MRPRPSFLFAVPLLACLLAAPVSAAPKKPAPADEPFFGSVDVNVVTVEVFVTDKDGKFVPDLTQADFEIREDGKPVEITNFFVASGAPAAGPEAAPGAPPAPLPPEQRLYLTIFFDNQTLQPAARNRVLASLKDFVRTRLAPGDQVMVVSYDGPGSMKVRQASTDSPGAVTAVLDEVATAPALGIDRQVDLRILLRQIENASTPNPRSRNQSDALAQADTLYAGIRLYGEQRYQEIRHSLKALGGFVDALAGLPGRKAVLYVSGGMSLRPAETLFQAWQLRFGSIVRLANFASPLAGFQTDTTTLFREIGERANANRVTFYSLGLPVVESASTAESSGSEVWTRDQENREILGLTQSLLLVAAPTGGQAAIDPNKPEVLLGQMRYDFDHYYSLGYAPADRKKPGNHKIEVKVTRPGLQVRHREGYRDRTTRDRLNQQTMAALLFGTGVENPLDVEVRFEGERAARKNKKEREVSLLVIFPMAKLVLLPQDRVHEGRVTVLLGTRDGEGRTSDITQIDVPVRVPDAQLSAAMGQSVAYRATLLMRPGPHTLVVGVRDEYGNVNSTVTIPYAGPAEAAKPARRGR
jgi:VWFA-related protein